jgi:hypothetical protein
MHGHGLGLQARAAAVLVAAVALHLLLDLLYRPWALGRDSGDFGLASSFTQATAVVGISAVMVLVERTGFWRDKAHEALLAIAPTLAMLGYECIQPWLPWGTFDPMDLIWTIGGGVLAWGIKLVVYDPVVNR